jgi:hypothetical protein
MSTAVQVWLLTWLVAAKESARVQSCPERLLVLDVPCGEVLQD